MFDFIVVGAGFAGTVIAERIANVLNKKVLIIEKRDHIGGNCYDYRNKDGIIIHKYGPHLFHTDYKEVWDYLSKFTEWDLYQHKVLAFIDGKKVPIPFNLNTIDQLFPQNLARTLQRKLLKRYSYDSQVSILELLKEQDEDLQFLAKYIYEKLFKNYTAKQWNMKPEEIDSTVTARVPIYINRDDRYFRDKYQGVPKEGYTKIFKRMLKTRNIKILLNTDFKEVLKFDIINKKIYFCNQEFRGKIIFTGPIDELFNYRFGELSYRSLDFQLETLEMEFYQEVAVVNYPNNYDFTRITEFKHIHPVKTEKTVILKEYPKAYKSGKDIPYYPVLTKANLEKYNAYKELAKKFNNLVLVGRLAEYKYYDMDDIIKRALEVFEEKIK